MEAPSLRLFFGLPLPPGVQETLGRWERSCGDIEGWSRAEGLHMTLAFLGQRGKGPSTLEPLGAAVAARHAAFDLSSAKLGSFSRGAFTRLLWLGWLPSPPLEAFATDLRRALEKADEAFDPKPFYPHVTLARFKQARRLDAFSDPPQMRFAADRLVLFESHPQGRYLPLRTWPLREV